MDALKRLFGFVLKRIACRFILKHLVGKYLSTELHEDQLNLSMGHGSAELRDLDVNPSIINDMLLGFGLCCVYGSIAKVRIQIPWKNLLEESTHVTIEGVHICLTKANCSDIVGRRGATRNAPAPPLMSPKVPLTKEPMVDDGLGDLERMIDRIVRKLIVCAMDINIELVLRSQELPLFKTPSKDVVLRVTLERLEAKDELVADGNEIAYETWMPRQQTKTLEFSGLRLQIISRDSGRRRRPCGFNSRHTHSDAMDDDEQFLGSTSATSEDINEKVYLTEEEMIDEDSKSSTILSVSDTISIKFQRSTSDVKAAATMGSHPRQITIIDVNAIVHNIGIAISPNQCILLLSIIKYISSPGRESDIPRMKPMAETIPVSFDQQLSLAKSLKPGDFAAIEGLLETYEGASIKTYTRQWRRVQASVDGDGDSTDDENDVFFECDTDETIWDDAVLLTNSLYELSESGHSNVSVLDNAASPTASLSTSEIRGDGNVAIELLLSLKIRSLDIILLYDSLSDIRPVFDAPPSSDHIKCHVDSSSINFRFIPDITKATLGLKFECFEIFEEIFKDISLLNNQMTSPFSQNCIISTRQHSSIEWSRCRSTTEGDIEQEIYVILSDIVSNWDVSMPSRLMEILERCIPVTDSLRRPSKEASKNCSLASDADAIVGSITQRSLKQRTSVTHSYCNKTIRMTKCSIDCRSIELTLTFPERWGSSRHRAERLKCQCCHVALKYDIDPKGYGDLSDSEYFCGESGGGGGVSWRFEFETFCASILRPFELPIKFIEVTSHLLPSTKSRVSSRIKPSVDIRVRDRSIVSMHALIEYLDTYGVHTKLFPTSSSLSTQFLAFQNAALDASSLVISIVLPYTLLDLRKRDYDLIDVILEVVFEIPENQDIRNVACPSMSVRVAALTGDCALYCGDKSHVPTDSSRGDAASGRHTGHYIIGFEGVRMFRVSDLPTMSSTSSDLPLIKHRAPIKIHSDISHTIVDITRAQLYEVDGESMKHVVLAPVMDVTLPVDYRMITICLVVKAGACEKDLDIAVAFRNVSLIHVIDTIWLEQLIDYFVEPLPLDASTNDGDDGDDKHSSTVLCGPPLRERRTIVDISAYHSNIQYTPVHSLDSKTYIVIDLLKVDVNVVNSSPQTTFSIEITNASIFLINDHRRLLNHPTCECQSYASHLASLGYITAVTADLVNVSVTKAVSEGPINTVEIIPTDDMNRKNIANDSMSVVVYNKGLVVSVCRDSFITLQDLLLHWWDMRDRERDSLSSIADVPSPMLPLKNILNDIDERAFQPMLTFQPSSYHNSLVFDDGLTTTTASTAATTMSGPTRWDIPGLGRNTDHHPIGDKGLHKSMNNLPLIIDDYATTVFHGTSRVSTTSIVDDAPFGTEESDPDDEEHATFHISNFQIKEKHFESLDDKQTTIPLSHCYPRPVVTISLENCSGVLKLYGGSDWDANDDDDNEGNLTNQTTMNDHSISASCGGGSGVGQEMVMEEEVRESIDEWGILGSANTEIDFIGRASSSYRTPVPPSTTTTTIIPSLVPPCRRRSQRDEANTIDLIMDGVNVTIYDFGIGYEYTSRIEVCIKDILLIDKLIISEYNKFLCRWMNGSDVDASMMRMDIDRVRSESVDDAGRQSDRRSHYEDSSELRITVTTCPMKLYIDQDSLMFLLDFFSSPDSSDTCNGADTYFQSVTISEVHLKVDYRPKHMDFNSLKQGNVKEFANLINLEGLELTLKGMQLRGVDGWDALSDDLLSAWMTSITRLEILNCIKRISPLRSLSNIGDGIFDLFTLPYDSFRRNGHMVRGMRKGAASFLRSVTLEAVGMAASVAIVLQTSLEHVSDILDQNRDTPRLSNKLASPPTSAKEGIKQAYQVLCDAVLATHQSMIHRPAMAYHRSGGGACVKAVIRSVPSAMLTPLTGATEALWRALMGFVVAMDKSQVDDLKDKYRKSH